MNTPKGWKLVPIEPTQKMLAAMNDTPTRPPAGYWVIVYDALLEASPTPPAQEEEPFMYAITGPDGKPYFDDICVSGAKGDLSDTVYYLNEENAIRRMNVPIYTHPENDELVKAAEEAADLLDGLHKLTHCSGSTEKLYADNIRKALRRKSNG